MIKNSNKKNTTSKKENKQYGKSSCSLQCHHTDSDIPTDDDITAEGIIGATIDHLIVTTNTITTQEVGGDDALESIVVAVMSNMIRGATTSVASRGTDDSGTAGYDCLRIGEPVMYGR